MNTRERELILSAIDWWESNRPMLWSKDDHLENPDINTCSSIESRLALAVAEFLKPKARAVKK